MSHRNHDSNRIRVDTALVPGYVSDLVVGEVKPLEGGVPPEGAEGDVPDLVVAQVEERQFGEAVHDEAHVRHVVQLVVVQVQLLHLWRVLERVAVEGPDLVMAEVDRPQPGEPVQRAPLQFRQPVLAQVEVL